MSLEHRVWKRVLKRGESDCWPWVGAKHNETGRGQIRVMGRGITAPRAVWLVSRGEIPAGLNVLHSCDNPNCVNPNHLWLGSQKQNIRDAIAKGRLPQSTMADDAHCSHGHALSGANLYVNPTGHRLCRECARASRRKYRSGHE